MWQGQEGLLESDEETEGQVSAGEALRLVASRAGARAWGSACLCCPSFTGQTPTEGPPRDAQPQPAGTPALPCRGWPAGVAARSEEGKHSESLVVVVIGV